MSWIGFFVVFDIGGYNCCFSWGWGRNLVVICVLIDICILVTVCMCILIISLISALIVTLCLWIICCLIVA